jgi:hypothetical protein
MAILGVFKKTDPKQHMCSLALQVGEEPPPGDQVIVLPDSLKESKLTCPSCKLEFCSGCRLEASLHARVEMARQLCDRARLVWENLTEELIKAGVYYEDATKKANQEMLESELYCEWKSI